MKRRATYRRPGVFRSWNVRVIAIRYVLPALAGLAAGLILASPIIAAILQS